MKTPEEWIKLIREDANLLNYLQTLNPHLISEIQEDALEDPLVNTSDEKELQIVKGIANSLSKQVERLEADLESMREKWHQSRSYLRAANKGAARNAMVAELAIKRYNEFLRKQNEA